MNRMALPIWTLLAATLSVAANAADAPVPAPKPPPVVQTFVATGPSTDADLARLRSVLEKVTGVVTVDVRKGAGGASLTVKGDVLYTLLAAAAKPIGFQMQHTPTRFFAAAGPSGEADLGRLRVELLKVPGVDKVEYGRDDASIALRVSGIASTASICAHAKAAGFQLRQVGAYVASGPTAEADLSRLRKTVQRAAGVEQVEMQALAGGATLLVYGGVTDPQLIAAAKSAGFTLAALRNAAGRRAEFAVNDKRTPLNEQKLREFVQGIEGIDEIDLRTTSDGPRLAVSGDRLKPDRIVAAAAEAGFELQIVENVTLPSLTPRAGRNTPAAYGDAILEDPIKVGEAAPQFTLLSQDGVRKISLSDYAGKKPVVLIFGSCT